MKIELKNKNDNVNYKKFFMIALFSLCVMNMFAGQNASEITKLDDWARIIVSLFTSTWLKAICVISLIALCIGMVTVGRQEPGMFKKFVPWIVGVIVMLSAASIVNFFFSDTSGLTDIGFFIDTIRSTALSFCVDGVRSFAIV